jgi:hypothetical protein
MLTDLFEISMAVDTPQSHLDVRWRSALRVGQAGRQFGQNGGIVPAQ